MVIPMIEVVTTVANQSFQIKGVSEKIIEVHESEDTLIGCEGIVEKADEWID
jgi:hypothetical protein